MFWEVSRPLDVAKARIPGLLLERSRTATSPRIKPVIRQAEAPYTSQNFNAFLLYHHGLVLNHKTTDETLVWWS